jgi:1-acyl-sn-glycerol-3-phosphate acyltransferase
MLRHLHVEVEIRNELPKWPRLWIANHLSWLDPLVLMSLRPSKAMAKAEVRDYPLIGRGAKKAGLVFVQREDPLSRAAAVARLTQALRNDMGIIVFPEGTTTNGQDLAPLQEGSLRAAYRLETDLLPIRLSSSSDHYPWVGDAKLLPHLWTLASAERTVVRAEGRKVLHPWNFKTEERWLDAVRESLMP